jgi:hypothetical protein
VSHDKLPPVKHTVKQHSKWKHNALFQWVALQQICRCKTLLPPEKQADLPAEPNEAQNLLPLAHHLVKDRDQK